jgi:regulatory protein
LDRREHGEKELVQKLRRRCSSVALVRETVARLEENDLLNEERYARRVFDSWRGRKVYGRLHLQAELLKKQVDEACIPVILALLSEEEEKQRVQAAWRQISGRRDKKYDCSTEKGVAALVRYFSARGFGPAMIRVGLALAKEEAGAALQTDSFRE